MKLIILLLCVVSTGLLAGGLFVIWIEYGSFSVNAEAYVKQQQNVIKTDLNSVMTVLGRISVILAIISAFLQRKNKTFFWGLIAAIVFLFVAGAITRLGNQPVNGIVSNWRPENIPTDWIDFREKWNTLHFIRTIASIVAFCLVVFCVVNKTEPTTAENSLS